MAMYGLGQQPLSQGYGQAPQPNYGASNIDDYANPHSFSDANNLFSPGQAHLGGGAGFGLDSGAGQAASFIGDPMDLFGNRAGYAQAQQDEIARQSAIASLNSMSEQYGTTLDLQKPFLQLGQQGLGQVGQYTQGQNYDTQLNEGMRQLRGSANASGLGNSSAAGRNMAGFVNNLTGEDMNRQYQQALRNIQIGQSAVGTLGQAASGLGSGASAIYGNWGQNVGQNADQYGQQRQDSFNSAGNAVAGAGRYFGSK